METETRKSRDTIIEVFEDVWRRDYDAFLYYAVRMTRGQRDLAEALVSETAIVVLNYILASKQQIKNPRAFFFRCLNNRAIDHFRRQERERLRAQEVADVFSVYDEGPQAVDHIIWRQDLSLVCDLMHGLSAKSREILNRYIVEDADYRTIAHELGISEALARKRMQLTRRALRQRFLEQTSSDPFHD